MKAFSHFLSTFLVFFLFCSLNAQITVGGKSYSHQFTGENALQTYQSDSKASLQAVVELATFPSKQEKQELNAKGVSFLGYIPKGNYLIEVQNMKDWELLSAYGILAITPFKPEFKYSENIHDGTIPAHALADEKTVKYLINVFQKEQLPKLKKELEANGYRVFNPKMGTQALEVHATPAELKALANSPLVAAVDLVPPPSQPENLPGRTDHRSNYINGAYKGAMSYDGEGVNVAMGDDGLIGPHIDYQGRVDQSKASGNNGDHGDHVAGTIFGAGNLDPFAEGMAPGASLFVYNVWDAVDDSPIDYVNKNIRITSTSYSNGCNAGYTNFAREADQHVYQNTSLMHVFSAGNSNGNDCGYGAGNQWGNVTGGVKIGKNVIAVANLTATDNIATSSSRGPAHDGRIKPDVSAVGTNVYSTIDVNDYDFKTGTSMSCPGTSGSLAQLYHAYKETYGVEPEAGLMKSIMMNTADDLGNPGPDYIFGYGRINNRRAVEVIEKGQFQVDSITANGTKTFTVNVPPGTQFTKMMVYWTDKEAITNANQALVNNLDMMVIDPNGDTLHPWVLDPTPNPANLNSNAVQAVDTLNNAEQVTKLQPTSGNYTVVVKGTSVPFGPQTFYLSYEFQPEDIVVIYPNGGEGFNPGETELIRWDAPEVFTSFTLEYSIDSGATWQSIGTTTNPSQRVVSWIVPNNITPNALVKVSSGSASDISNATFTIASVPQNLTIDWACPDSIKLSWGPVPGISHYEVSQLGAMYMDSVGTSTSNSFVVKGINPLAEHWFSVRSVINQQSKGRRAIAIQHSPGTFNCPIPEDLDMISILYPPQGRIPSCLNDTASSVRIKVKNTGTQAVTNIPLTYQINSNTAVNETFMGTVPAGDSIDFTFSQTENFSSTTTKNIRAWVSYGPDGNSYNDTVRTVSDGVSGSSQSLPVIEDLESFNLCGTNFNCGVTVCNLKNGWENYTNGVEDDIDWRTDQDGTPSNNTGPDFDHTTGSSAGNYLYLEASNGCNFQEAVLASPCIDIPIGKSVEFSFWYHMLGAHINSLHVDALVQGELVRDITTPIVGNQGGQWLERKVNLSSYAGQTVVLLIRGYTGGDYMGDIALDDFSIYEVNSAPEASFTTPISSVCLYTPTFLYDVSTNAPSQWQWNIQPNTFTFINGTSANSPNPVVSFSQAGFYDITLIASNNNGADTITQKAFIEADAGIFPPLSETFDQTSFPPPGWSAVSSGNPFQWQYRFGVLGKDSTFSTALFFNNYSLNAGGAEDELMTQKIDLTNSQDAYLTFDVAYVTKPGGFNDGLRVEISTDCGVSYQPTGYFKSGSDLATASPSSTLWGPASPNDWRVDTIDLVPYLGQSVIVKFVNINGNGNCLHLDNINVYDFSPPVAGFSYQQPSCEGDSTVIFDNSFGYQKSFVWDFGPNASPQTATSAGPHKVLFPGAGTYNVSVVVTNPLGTDSTTETVTVVQGPTASFGSSMGSTGKDFTFYSQSNNADSVAFFVFDTLRLSGDSAQYTFADKGEYEVKMVAYSSCGADTTTSRVTAINIASEEVDSQLNLDIFPNPVQDQLTILHRYGKLKVKLSTLLGETVYQQTWSNGERFIDFSALANGVYLLEVETEGKKEIVKITKTN